MTRPALERRVSNTLLSWVDLSHQLNCIGRLQRVQNQAACILTRSTRREHITPVLKQLYWLKVRERIRYKILILTHKAFYANVPPYFCSLVVKRENVVSTRSSQDGYLLCKPPISRTVQIFFLNSPSSMLLLMSGIA